ncbi:MAG: hypothetical protein ACKVOJ_12315 [Sphingomonadaceae bacterium]
MRHCAIIFTALLLPTAAWAQAEPGNIDDLLQTHLKATSVVVRCAKAERSDEIVICARRDADRYRVPFVGYEAGDPHGEGFWGERERLQHKTTPCQDRGPFLVGCGPGVGVSVSVGLDGRGLKRRKLAD